LKTGGEFTDKILDMGSAVASTRRGQYSLLEVALPGRPPEPAGVVLYDPGAERVDLRLRRDWERIASEEDAEVLELLEADLSAKAREMGPEAFLAHLEDTLSNVLRITGREPVLLGDFDRTLNRLYTRLVPATVLRFETHLPVYSCRAAAGRFGDQMQVEPEGWVEAPPGLKLTPEMFVATVVGHSMEPQIPDGSRCIFRANVTGSRQGKWVLVENYAESEEGGQRYTVKRYRSEKVYHEDGTWAHERIIMEPLNPEFESWELTGDDQCRVIAEFVRVLD